MIRIRIVNTSTATATVTAVNDAPTIAATTDGSADYTMNEKDKVRHYNCRI